MYDNIQLNSPQKKEYFGQICRENQTTCFVFNIFFPENRALRDINQENMVEKIGHTLKYNASQKRSLFVHDRQKPVIITAVSITGDFLL